MRISVVFPQTELGGDWRGDRRQVPDELAQWADAGATHVSVNTMGAGLRTVDDHLSALQAVAEP